MFTPLQERLMNLDECECSEGESCYVCQNYDDKNMVFGFDNNGEDTRFLKIPIDLLGNQELMAKWVFENSDILIRGDYFFEGELLENQEILENNFKDLMVVRGFCTLVNIWDFIDFDELTEEESVFKINNPQIGSRKKSYFEIKDEL